VTCARYRIDRAGWTLIDAWIASEEPSDPQLAALERWLIALEEAPYGQPYRMIGAARGSRLALANCTVTYEVSEPECRVYLLDVRATWPRPGH
jgi:hypothetical protein